MVQHTVKYSDTCLLFICSQHTVKYTNTGLLFIWSNIVTNTLLPAFSLYGPTKCQIHCYMPSLYMVPTHCQIHWYRPSLYVVLPRYKYSAAGLLFIWSNIVSNTLLQALSLYGPTHCQMLYYRPSLYMVQRTVTLLHAFSLYGPTHCQMLYYRPSLYMVQHTVKCSTTGLLSVWSKKLSNKSL
jgi:hypothetical protein